jgi:hypothetical protein
MDKENPIKAIKRGEEPISTQLAREVCSYEDFQDFFDIHPLFTHPPHHLEVTFFQRLKASNKSTSVHLSTIGTLRAQFGIAIGIDPFAVELPKTRIHRASFQALLQLNAKLISSPSLFPRLLWVPNLSL